MKEPESVTPKFDIGTHVYVILRDFRIGSKYNYFVMPTKIEWYKVYCIGKNPKKHIAYRAKLYGVGKSYMIYEKDIFLDEDEAQKECDRRNI